MSNVARLRIEDKPDTPMYLGPARVVETGALAVEVELPQGNRERARVALAYAYEACVGDEVLVIGNADGHWIIGIISGKGPAVLRFPADAELSAGGTLRITADRGVDVRAHEFSVTTQKIRMVASEVAHSFKTLRQRVQELLSVQAGQTHTVVEGSMHSQAKNATILTEEKVSINGKEVHLG
jgi:siderophore synthetase component